MWFVEATVGEESIGELLLDVTPAGGGLARAPDTDGGQGSSRRETLECIPTRRRERTMGPPRVAVRGDPRGQGPWAPVGL